MSSRFTMSYTVLGRAGTGPTASRVGQLLDEHRPWEMVDNMALIIMDQTSTALLEILGPSAQPSGDDGHVQVTRPVDPADPDSPLLCVNASATHCCISLIDGSFYGDGAGTEYKKRHTSPEQKSNLQYRLARTTVSVSPGTLHVARAHDDGGRGDYWACADLRPDVSKKCLFGVLETIRMRLDAVIRLEARLLEMARASGCRSGKLYEIAEVRAALKKMRREVDLNEIMRRRCKKRRPRLIQEISCRLDVDQAYDAEVLAKRLSALHVGQKRPHRVQDINCRPAAEMGVNLVDDAEVLMKRLRTLHV